MFRILSLVMSLGVFLVAGVANAADKKETIVEMVNGAVAHYEEVGQEEAFKDFAVKGGKYNQGEFYVFVSKLDDRTMIFHGENEKLVGKNLEKLKDTDGKSFVVEMREVAEGPGEGWVDYKWTHPETKKIAQKRTYVKRSGDVYFAMGYYD